MNYYLVVRKYYRHGYRRYRVYRINNGVIVTSKMITSKIYPDHGGLAIRTKLEKIVDRFIRHCEPADVVYYEQAGFIVAVKFDELDNEDLQAVRSIILNTRKAKSGPRLLHL
jgi:hypothetical protein